MAYSVEAISKNTFLTFVADTTDDELVPASLMGSARKLPRSRSAETARCRPEAEEFQERTQQSLQRLTSFLNSGVLQPLVEVSRAQSSAQTACAEASRTSSPAATSPVPAIKRSSHQNLTPTTTLILQNLWDKSLYVPSNCSLSTMAPNDASEISSPTSGLKRAEWSSGSICSMVAWADMPEGHDFEAEIELDIEAGAWAPREEAAFARPALPCPHPTPCPQPTVTGKVTAEMSHSKVPKMGIKLDIEAGAWAARVAGAWAAHEEAAFERRPQPTVTGKVTAEMSHSMVPKIHDMAEMYKSSQDAPPTTLMIRNIPGKYSQDDLIMDLNDKGFGSTYDFLYLPIDKVTSNNVGYAFVNFVDPATAARCIESFQDHRFDRLRRSSNKFARISVAHLQGLANNLQHYEKTIVNASREKGRRPLVVLAALEKICVA